MSAATVSILRAAYCVVCAFFFSCSENDLREVKSMIAENAAALAAVQQEIAAAEAELKQVNLCYNMMVGILVYSIFVLLGRQLETPSKMLETHSLASEGERKASEQNWSSCKSSGVFYSPTAHLHSSCQKKSVIFCPRVS